MNTALTSNHCVVIVGAGLAGVRVAESLRTTGFLGRIVLIGEEAHAPYDRPPLSKTILMSEEGRAGIQLISDENINELGIEMLLGQKVTAIDRNLKRICLSNGETHSYDRLVLATGSNVRSLPELPQGNPNVHYLRSLDDAYALRNGLQHSKRVAIIGAGVIGLEVAAAAKQQGCEVVIVEAAERVMARATCPTIGAFVRRRHEKEGVVFKFGVRVVGAEIKKDQLTLLLSDDSGLAVDRVIVGVGVEPNIHLARQSGLECGPQGIVVDGFGATSDSSVYAAGEVAHYYNERIQGLDRQETWAHAASHGDHVGRCLVSQDQQYTEIGSYWSDQYDFTLNVIGDPIGDEDVLRGNLEHGKFVVFHLCRGVVMGISALNDARTLRVGKTLLGKTISSKILADATRDLRALSATNSA